MRKYLLVTWLITFTSFASAETIDYLIPEEITGAYQSKNFPNVHSNSLGMIDSVVTSIIKNTAIELRPRVLPAFRSRALRNSEPSTPWMTFTFSGSTLSAKVAGSPPESWMSSPDTSSFHLASFRTQLWYIEPSKHKPKTRLDLANKDVILMRSVSYKEMGAWQKELGFNVVTAGTADTGLKMLISQRADFLFLSEASIRWHFRRLSLPANSLYKIEDSSLSPRTEIYLVWSPKIAEHLQQHLRKALIAMEQSGELDKIRQRNFFNSPHTPNQ